MGRRFVCPTLLVNKIPGMDEEPIVGNEMVHTNIQLPPLIDEDEEIVPKKIVPSFE